MEVPYSDLAVVFLNQDGGIWGFQNKMRPGAAWFQSGYRA